MVKNDKPRIKPSNNTTNTVVQKITHKVQEKVPIRSKDNEALDASKKSNKKGEDKGLVVGNQRQSQYIAFETNRKLDSELRNERRQQLKEALILAEIIGRPRCKTRVNRRNRRSYGD